MFPPFVASFLWRHVLALVRACSLIGVFLTAATAHAQVQIDLKLGRKTYILYEPVIATVTITNLARAGPAVRGSGWQAVVQHRDNHAGRKPSATA